LLLHTLAGVDEIPIVYMYIEVISLDRSFVHERRGRGKVAMAWNTPCRCFYLYVIFGTYVDIYLRYL